MGGALADNASYANWEDVTQLQPLGQPDNAGGQPGLRRAPAVRPMARPADVTRRCRICVRVGHDSDDEDYRLCDGAYQWVRD